MPRRPKPEWIKFKVSPLSIRRNWVEVGCQTLDEISHVSHIKNAVNIVSDGKIKSSLIFDESKLDAFVKSPRQSGRPL